MVPAEAAFVMNRVSRISAQPDPPRREPSGVHRKQPDPEAFYVRRHRRGGYCVMIEGRENPLARHDTADDAMLLAELLAKKGSARVIGED